MNETYFEEETFQELQYSGELFENYRFVDCTFINCVFEACELVRCSFSGCTFQQCVITEVKAQQHAQIQYGSFIECQLTNINWSDLLPSGRFADPIQKMQACRLRYTTFTGMNFKKFEFSGNCISDSIFAECQLAESSFRACKLDRTEFFQCDMQKADFREATGYQVDIASCKMKGSRFSFPEAANLLNSLEINVDWI